MTNGNISILFESYISKGFWIAAVIIVCLPIALRFRRKLQKKHA